MCKSNWAIEKILMLDAAEPRLVGHFLRASAERQHVIAAHLAAVDQLDSAGAALLLAGRHPEILAAGFGSVACGFRRALARAGDEIHPAQFYRDLYDLLSNADENLRRLISQLNSVTPIQLAAIKRLPPEACSANLVNCLGSSDAAGEIAQFYALLVEAGVDPAKLAARLRNVSSRAELAKVWRGQIDYIRLPAHPVPAGENYRPIHTARELAQLARRFRNCARRYLVDALDEKCAFAEFSGGRQPLVVHLVQSEAEWQLADCFSKGNGPVDPASAASAIEYLAAHGIQKRQHRGRKEDRWDPLRELLMRLEFARDMDDEWA